MFWLRLVRKALHPKDTIFFSRPQATTCSVGLECVVTRSQPSDRSGPGDVTSEYQTACVSK